MSPTWFTQLGFGPISASGLVSCQPETTLNSLFLFLPSFLPHKYCDVGLYIVWNYKYVSLQPDSTKIAVKQSPFWTMVWFLDDLRFMRRSILGDSSPWSGLRFLSSFILKQMFKASRFLMKSQAKPALAPAYSPVSAFIFIQSSADSFFYASATVWLNIVYLPVFCFIKNIEVIQGT